MLRTVSRTRTDYQALRIASVVLFIILISISAKIKIDIGLVPITMQPLVVLLAGMALGRRDGTVAVLSYVLLIAGGLPLDSNGLGVLALFSPTGGYLFGFIAGAYVAGELTENGANRVWQRWLAGLVAIAVIYVFGAAYLKVYTGLGWQETWATGVAPFVFYDVVKALIAAGMVEGMRVLLLRNSDLYYDN